MFRTTIAVAAAAALVAVPAAAQAAPGDLDPTFGTAGVVLDRTSYFANDVVATDDGGGILPPEDWTLVKLRADGSRDPAFGGHGVVHLGDDEHFGNVDALAIDPQGRVLAAAGSDVARVRPDGTLDPSWGGADGFADVDLGAYDDEDVEALAV